MNTPRAVFEPKPSDIVDSQHADHGALASRLCYDEGARPAHFTNGSPGHVHNLQLSSVCGREQRWARVCGTPRHVRIFCGAAVVVPQASRARNWRRSKGTPPRANPASRGSRSWPSVAPYFIVCGGVLAGLLLPAIQAAREAGRRASCMNHVKQIDLALHNYYATYGHFPPAATADGKPLMSSRVAILPFLGQDPLFRQYDTKQPWDSPKNRSLVLQMPRDFRCPSDSEAADSETSYVMVTGENTIGGTPGSPGTVPSDFAGGSSKTIMVLEVHGLKISWTEPRNITLDELLSRVQSGERIGHVSGFTVGIADGSVRHFHKIDTETLRRLATLNGQKPAIIDEN